MKKHRKKRSSCSPNSSRGVRGGRNRRLQLESLEERRLLAVLGNPLFRVNAGGAEIAATPTWQADTGASPSSALVNGNTAVFTSGSTVSTTDPSIPVGTPAGLFQSERFDKGGAPNMEWEFGVTPGDYEVRLYFAETWSGAFADDVRKFDVAIEGAIVLDDYDVHADVGALTGVVKSFTVTSDAVLDIDFGRVSQNPSIKGIEIIPWIEDGSSSLGASDTSVSFGEVLAGSSAQQAVTLTNNGSTGSPSITIDPTQASITPGGSPFSFAFPTTSPIVLAPGESTSVTVTYAPTAEGNDAANLDIPNDGDVSPLTLSISGVATVDSPADNVLYRVNAGGPEVTDSPSWLVDSAASPSPFSNAGAGGNSDVSTTTDTITLGAAVPAGTPVELFQSERFDNPAAEDMEWDFSVTPGIYEVRLYFAEVSAAAFGDNLRVFDIEIENILVEPAYDIFADVGSLTGTTKSYIVSSDANLDIDFQAINQNPLVNAIEVIAVPTGMLLSSQDDLDFGDAVVGATLVRQLTLTNDNASGGPFITVDPAQASISPGGSPFAFVFSQSSPIVLGPGESTLVTATYTPTAEANDSATLTIPNSGPGSPLSISLMGTGVAEIPVAFEKSELTDTTGLVRPTSLQFGPDGRLYVAQQNGLIQVYEIVRNGENDYEVVESETITLIQSLLNHDDDGTPRPDVTDRLLTGLLVAGTAQNPVIYAGSSDPRIGGGETGADTNLDTNSSIISRLTLNGGTWQKLDLVRGLPRSNEQHAINGLTLDPNDPDTLYVTLGGNTNMGAPSNNFAFLPEYAYSAAILRVDLSAIGETTYDLPTLDDEDQPGVDTTDPFGGNDGKNQAVLEENGPVQLHAVGMRNPFDLVITANGRMYSIDNGPNAGWGGVPVNEGPAGNATNDVNESDSDTFGDGLHFISGPGYYGGHPNPTRSNLSNTFNASNPQSPALTNNPIESDYQTPGVDDQSLIVYDFSTNGLTEYRATNFGGAMQGDLLTASFDNTIKRIKLSADGTQVVSSEDLFSNVGFRPLDVTSPAVGPFAGTIWVADIALETIYVFEPSDGAGGTVDDRDADGYSNDDELANGTNPDNPADIPADYDQDFLSDLLDPDDDNDLIFDEVDLFAVDADNGTSTPIGTFYTWENEGEDLGGLLGMGFTGLMNNGQDNYEALYDPSAVTAGGAAGVFTIDMAGAGTARAGANTQFQGFHFGFNPVGATTPFAATTRILAAFGGVTPQSGQEMGLTLGTGDQDNYIQIVLSGEGGGAIQVVSEFGGADTQVASQPLTLPGPSTVDFWLSVNPIAETVQASYSIDDGVRIDIGGAIAIPTSWLASALAAGIISVDPASVGLPVTWDHLGVVEDATSAGGGAAKVEVYPTGGLNNSSTARPDSFRIYNNSTDGKQISSVLIDLSSSYLPDMLFDPNGTAGDTRGVPFIVNSGQTETGLTSHQFLVERDGGFEQLRIFFDDFDVGESFTFRTDIDPTSVKGTPSPGPSNSADISGLEVTGAGVTVAFDDGVQVSGELFALEEGASFYKVHSEVVLTEAPLGPAPSLSLLGITTPSIVTSASQTVRVFGPVGANVRLLQTEVALHLDGVADGGFDVDPYEANKAIVIRDDVATVGPTGFVDIPVTLTDSIVAGGLTYFSAVIDLPDGRTSNVSNVIKVALNDLPPGSNTSGPTNDPPMTASLAVTPNSTVSGPVSITASATDTDDNIVAAEYFIDTLGAEGTGTALAAADGAFDSMNEALTGSISSGVFDTLSIGLHTVFVRTQDATGDWGNVASATFNKQSEGGTGFVWLDGADSPVPRWEAQGIAIDEKVYVFAGYDNLGPPLTTVESHVYNAATNQWSSIADAPEKLTHTGIAVDGTKIYLIGGYVGDNPGGSIDRVWVYDTVADTWSAGTPLPEDRGAGGAAIVGRSLHFFGGATRTDGIVAATDHPDHWILDLGATDSPSDDALTWTPAADLPNARNHVGAVAVDGLIYAIGGQYKSNEQTGNQDDVHRYDPSTDQWTQLADLPQPTGHIMSSTFAIGSEILVVGGVTQSSEEVDTVFAYNTLTDTWRELASLPEARQSPLAAFADGKVIVNGGATSVLHGNTWIGDAAELLASSNTPTDNPPTTSNLVLSPIEAIAGPIDISATATDGNDNVVAAEYFLDTLGAEGTGIALAAADGTFDSQTEDLTGAISASEFDSLTLGSHTVFVRSQDASGKWSNVVNTTFNKLSGSEPAVLYRVNAGGPEVTGTPEWGEDTDASPSEFGNAGESESNSRAVSTSAPIDLSHPSIPAGTPVSLFQFNRADPPNGTEIAYDFSLTPGDYEVRLYFAEIWSGGFTEGARVFDVLIEDTLVLDDYDIFTAAGAGNKGVMESFIITSSEELDIDLIRDTRAPLIAAIEIIDLSAPLSALSAPDSPQPVLAGPLMSSSTSGGFDTLDAAFASGGSGQSQDDDLLLLLAQSSADTETGANIDSSLAEEESSETSEDPFTEFGLSSEL